MCKMKRDENRRNIVVDKELWNEFSEACKVAGVGRSTYLQAAMKGFVSMNKKNIVDVVKESMKHFVENDQDLSEDEKLKFKGIIDDKS